MRSCRSIPLLFFFALTLTSAAQNAGELPAVYEGVGITERLGEFIPMDTRFANAEGDSVSIADLVPEGQPVVLNFVYHTCPMLCSILLDQLVEGLQGLDRMPGESFQVVTVSMASFETADLAQRQKERYLAMLDRPGAEEGWHFLTGTEKSVRTLSDAVGFDFKWVDETNEFAHPAALIFLGSDGKITRYLHGMHYPSDDLDKAIIEASSGNVASVIDRILLYCYRYDPDSNSYVAHASNIMKLGGLLTLGLLGILLFVLWRRESHGNAAAMAAHA